MRSEVNLLARVRVFDGAEPTKEYALKPLEEAAEVAEAWKALERSMAGDAPAPRVRAAERALVDEIADAVQALCNLAWAVGCDDLTAAMARCERRNRERGRIS
ncbi:hypothetical protein [Candidatus Collinsella stercoripullorum]|uniref:hypothetical protein n=1 Tax=Candidatus Collinsella stercoripullorum TaxID=2838522 RepID=UPI0022E77DD3|nr:hypothetical protein [Candidatus Collinsella stercoripullorum]